MGAADYPLKSPGKAVAPLTPAQKAAATRRKNKAEADRLAKVNAQRLAQIVNLHIAGFSLAEIGAQIGATAQEVDRMLTQDAARYVRSQPSLRVYVRNFVSGKYTELLEAVWEEATDKAHPQKLENQDRALRILDRMARLHGAEAPTQSEITVEAAPEAVEKMVNAIAATQGMGYDASIFDVVEGEVVADDVHRAAEQASAATLDASEMVGTDQPGDEDWTEQYSDE